MLELHYSIKFVFECAFSGSRCVQVDIIMHILGLNIVHDDDDEKWPYLS